MADVTNIGRPYARAAFEYAKANNLLPEWSCALQAWSLAVQDHTMQLALSNPDVTQQALVELLMTVANTVINNDAAELSQSLQNFLGVLAENKRLQVLPAVANLFQADLAKSEGYMQLTVTSAYALNKQQQADVAKKLEARLHSDVKINYQADESLIGGLVVRSGDWVLDDSIRGKLERLQSALI